MSENDEKFFFKKKHIFPRKVLLEATVFFKKKRFHPFKRQLQQNWVGGKYAGASRPSYL